MASVSSAQVLFVQSIFEKLENEMREVNSNTEALKKNFLELTELKHILRKTQTFFDEVSVFVAAFVDMDYFTDYLQIVRCGSGVLARKRFVNIFL